MTKAFIADASVAVVWVHPAQATTQTAAMLDAIAEGAALGTSIEYAISEVADRNAGVVAKLRKSQLTFK